MILQFMKDPIQGHSSILRHWEWRGSQLRPRPHCHWDFTYTVRHEDLPTFGFGNGHSDKARDSFGFNFILCFGWSSFINITTDWNMHIAFKESAHFPFQRHVFV